MQNIDSINPKDWIKFAKKNLMLAQILLKDVDATYSSYVCFLCQQAVEKYLKAFILKHKGQIEQKNRTHHLIYLADQCKKYKLDLYDYRADLRSLNELYISTRYPGLKGELYQEDAAVALKSAKKVIKFIKPFLKTRSK